MKNKEGGVMDIQKEREAFECEFKQTDYYIAHGDISTLMLCDDQYALDDVQVSFEMWQAAKAQAVPEGFILVSAEQMSQWGHMANCAQEYGCPECFEARGYAHSLACEINAYFNVSEAQEPANAKDQIQANKPDGATHYYDYPHMKLPTDYYKLDDGVLFVWAYRLDIPEWVQIPNRGMELKPL